jgi:inhibitor of KinA sporulation pathway (predicted exonuclease)
MGLTPVGREHSGLDDAMNAALVVQAMMQRGVVFKAPF